MHIAGSRCFSVMPNIVDLVNKIVKIWHVLFLIV